MQLVAKKALLLPQKRAYIMSIGKSNASDSQTNVVISWATNIWRVIQENGYHGIWKTVVVFHSEIERRELRESELRSRQQNVKSTNDKNIGEEATLHAV